MENIDWSQAPEGATHFCTSSNCTHKSFIKIIGDEIWWPLDSWVASIYKVSDLVNIDYRFIAIPPPEKPLFKVDDKVYCPSLTTEILVLKPSLSALGNYVLTLSFACRMMRFTASGKDHIEDINNSIFHATSENHKLLEQLYQCTFEKPALTGSAQIIKLLNENTTGKPILCVSKKDPTVILQIISYNYSLGFFVDINKKYHAGSLELFTNFTPHQLD